MNKYPEYPEWELAEFNNDKMIPTVSICRRNPRTGGRIVIGSFDSRRDAQLAVAGPKLLAALKEIKAEARFDADSDSLSRGDKLLAIQRLATDAIGLAS